MKKILVVSHDAGGAEIISSWVNHNSFNHYRFVLDGPARNVFNRKIQPLNCQSLDVMFQEILACDMVLTGTSWASTLENQAIHFALENNIKVASYLESWVNYSERFKFNGILELPDEIWVGDREAQCIALKEFPQEKVQYVENCYFLDMKNEMEQIQVSGSQSDRLRLLFISEPIAKGALWRYGDERYLGYTEYEVIKYFFSCLEDFLPMEEIESITIRLHPADEVGKYSEILQEYSQFPICISHNNTLAYDCVAADYIVGCSSVALIIGLLAKKRVFSCIPNKNSTSGLPHKEIVSFREYVENRKVS